MEEIEETLREFLEAGLAPNSRKAYHTGQSAWMTYCALNEYAVLMEGQSRADKLEAEKRLMFFAVFLAPFVKISTIRNYVSGVRSLHVERNGYVLWEGGLRLPQLLKGIARKYPSLVRKRAPVTLEVLWEWFQLLDLKKKFTHGTVGSDSVGFLRPDAQVGVCRPCRG